MPAEPLSVLELFHGPTAAFKDFGARFLAATLERIPRDDPRRLTILVATSGDTGGAVAAAFYDRPWVDVVVLYPAWPRLRPPGKAARVLGPQRAHAVGRRHVRRLPAHGEGGVRRSRAGAALLLSSANSINVGRLLPQMVYYAQASLELLAP